MSAFLNAMREEGTRDEIFDALAETVAERNALRASNAELIAALKEARVWLDASLGMVRGEGPPNWDGIRDAATRIDSVLRKAGTL